MILIILILSSSFVLAYNKLCLTDGQGTPKQNPVYTCTHDLCIVCVTENGYPTLPQLCGEIQGCSFLNDSGADFTPPIISILSPLNKTVYNITSLLLEIQTNEEAKLYLLDNNNERRGYSLLSDKTTYYSRFRRFDEGYNSFTVKAIDPKGNTAYKTVEFNVDTKKPKIVDTLPDSGSYVTGTFLSVEYDEENIESVALHYGLNADDNQINIPDCPSGKGVTCGTDVNLKSFNGHTVYYYFEVSDSINTVSSETKSVIVDTSAPIIDVLSPLNQDYGVKNINLLIGINEEVEKLNYFDNNEEKPKEKNLCKNCNNYDKGKSFNDGSHSLTFVATDAAGNKANKSVNFTTDSQAPKIKKTEPINNKHTNGKFLIEYTEVNLKSVVLTIIDGSSAEHNFNILGCESGKNKKCQANLNLGFLENQSISYYFMVSDLFFGTASKLTKNNVVDTINPIFTNITPQEGQIFNTKSIDLSIETSEDANIAYSLDGGRETNICSKCSSADKRITVRFEGQHSIALTATDFAGNSMTETRNFEVELP